MICKNINANLVISISYLLHYVQELFCDDDNQRKQANFRNKFDFPFPLLADEDRKVIEAFGVWGPKKFMGREFDGIHRKTFLIDADGVVSRVIDKVKTKDHAAQILEEA